MSTLLVAAGGGGDAVGLLLSRRLLLAPGEDVYIATYAWERLRVDPLPGPRGVAGFRGLEPIDGSAMEIIATSETIPSGRSHLPRLKSASGARLFLLDPVEGGLGLRRQIRSLCKLLQVDHLIVLDVGGDVTAVGTEEGLLSPLADALAVAACADCVEMTDVLVTGCGVDGELEQGIVEDNLHRLSGKPIGSIGPQDVARVDSVLGWHPTEATSIVAAAAVGVSGVTETRRQGITVQVGSDTSIVWRVTALALWHHSLIIGNLAETNSLESAECVVDEFTPNEMHRERDRSPLFDSALPESARDSADIISATVEYAQGALARGAAYLTTRRLLEGSNNHFLESEELCRLLPQVWLHPNGSHLWEAQQLASIRPLSQ